MGVQFFGGMFYKCIDSDGQVLPATIIPDRNACIAFNYEWINSHVNFDNALNGFLALLQVVSLVFVLNTHNRTHIRNSACSLKRFLSCINIRILLLLLLLLLLLYFSFVVEANGGI